MGRCYDETQRTILLSNGCKQIRLSPPGPVNTGAVERKRAGSIAHDRPGLGEWFTVENQASLIFHGKPFA